MRTNFSAAISSLLFSLTFVSAGNGQNGGTWLTLAPMPSQRQELATAVLHGKIYVIGGYDVNGVSTSTVDVYNPNIDSWASAHSIPLAVNHNSAAVAAGKLYSFGGSGGQVFVYHSESDSWTPVAPTNFSHDGTAAVGVINDKIYVAGGNSSSSRALEVYDPVANTWTTRAQMAVGRNHTGGGAINGKFYVVGGRGEANSATALEVYDPQTNTWTTLAPMPTGRSGIGVAAVNGELWVFGGELPTLHGEVEAYNPATNTWRSLPNMPTPRHGISASVIGNRIYLPGGGVVQGFGASNINEVFIVDPEVTSASSRKMHGFVGEFDIDLPFTGAPGIECRTGGTTNDYVMVVAFSGSVTVNGNPQAAVTSGIGTVGSDGNPNGGLVFVSGNTVTVPLTNVANAQTINVTLFGVNGTSNFVIPMSVLAGDVNGNGAVNAGDIVGTKSRIGQPINATNFRADVNASGAINATDVSIVKSYTGTGLP